jgi:hypothetical protein
MKAVIYMRGIYGGSFAQTRDFKDDKHLENWLRFMDRNQDRVKVIGTKVIGDLSKDTDTNDYTLEDKITGMFIQQMKK